MKRLPPSHRATRRARGTRLGLVAILASLAACSPTATTTPSALPSRPASPTAGHSPSPSATLAGSATPRGPRTFALVPDETTARFRIEERLRNRPNTVVGSASVVRGEIVIDPEDPRGVQLGLVEIDAATFVTDNELRDSSIRGLILESAVYPTITFVATSIDGLPDVAGVGDRLTLEVTGDLTIRRITRSVAFRVVVEVAAPDRLEGEAEAAILRSDYGLTIPEVPNVAEVGEEVQLRLVFTAVAAP